MIGVARGPEIYRVRGVEGALAAGTLAAPTQGTAVIFAWPRRVFVESLFVLARGAAVVDPFSAADLAGIELSIFDQHERSFVTDGRVSLFAPCRALIGPKQRWFPLGVTVEGRDRWRIQFQRVVAGDAVVPSLYFRIREREPISIKRGSR